MLGAVSVGAVYSSTSPDFGTRGVLDRFGQISPVVLFAADGYTYGGKRFDCLERLAEIRAGLPSLRATVVVGDAPADTVAWDDFLAPHRNASPAPAARFRPIIRGTCCIRRAPPARRSASCTARVVCCSSTSRSTSCTATSVPVIA